jgi:hypothetical protein
VTINLYAAWIGLSLACLAGMVAGLFFHREDFLGGYGNWTRRLMRLGHISLFGLAFVNFVFYATCKSLNLETGLTLVSTLFLVGAISMPLVCYTSAFFRPARHLFFIPVLSITVGAITFTLHILEASP